jgi:hypothetical protein
LNCTDGAGVIQVLAQKSAGYAASAWDLPVPFPQFPVPPFPTAALPDWLRDYIEALAVATQTLPDLAGLLALTACSATVAICRRQPTRRRKQGDQQKTALRSELRKPMFAIEAEGKISPSATK